MCRFTGKELRESRLLARLAAGVRLIQFLFHEFTLLSTCFQGPVARDTRKEGKHLPSLLLIAGETIVLLLDTLEGRYGGRPGPRQALSSSASEYRAGRAKV